MCFNPPSASMPRESTGNACSTTLRRFQSALGIDAEGKIPCNELDRKRAGFNPPSASMPRESSMDRLRSTPRRVSIRPRHRCRGKEPRGRSWMVPSCFNPPSASMPRESSRSAMRIDHIEFQSALGIDAEGKVGLHGIQLRNCVSIRPRHRCRGKALGVPNTP